MPARRPTPSPIDARGRLSEISFGAGSEVPRADEFKACRREVRKVPRRQATAIDARDCRDHSVGRGHGPALSERCTHDVAIGERGGFRQGEDPVGKTPNISSFLVGRMATVLRRVGPTTRPGDGLRLDIVSVTAASARRIAVAYGQWGRGAHSAGLNFCDCFSHVLAKEHACPLLYVGEDFSKTDLASAVCGQRRKTGARLPV
jgi:hypothetical protein